MRGTELQPAESDLLAITEGSTREFVFPLSFIRGGAGGGRMPPQETEKQIPS